MPAEPEELDKNRELDLARAACAGDEEAFGELFQYLYPRIHRTIWAMVSDEAEAHDVAQDAWIKAWQRRDRFNFQSGFYTWVHRIAVNTALDWLRKRSRLRNRFLRLFKTDSEPEPFDHADSETPAPDDSLKNRETGKLIERALRKLPEEQRVVFVLREYEDLTYEEIAKLVDCKIGTVMSRLHLARKKLKERLSKELS